MTEIHRGVGVSAKEWMEKIPDRGDLFNHLVDKFFVV